MKVSITENARIFILKRSAQLKKSTEDLDNPVPAITWMLRPNSGKHLYTDGKNKTKFNSFYDGKWVLGWYERERINGDFVFLDNGIELAFEPPISSDRSEKFLIDYIDKEFEIVIL